MKINFSSLLLKILIVLQYVNLVSDFFPSYFQIIVFTLFFITLLQNKEIMSKGIKISFISLLIFIIVLLRCYAANQINLDYYSPFQSAIARYQFLVYPLVFFYVINQNLEIKKGLFKLSIISIFITVLISFYYMIFVDPQAVRNTLGVNYFGVGDFQLMYAIALLSGPLLILIIDRKKNKMKSPMLLIAFISFILCLLMCNLVTTWIIAIFSILLSVFIFYRNNIKYPLVVIIGGALLTLRGFIVKFLRNLANKNIFYWSTNNKIVAIANVLSGNFIDTDTLGRRSMLINQSLSSFKSHPYFGIDFKDHVAGNVGCHSQWADDLARFGIIGNIFIVINYIYVAKATISNCTKRITRCSMICAWITFLILGFLNPCLSGTILMAMFVVIPTFDSLEVSK